MANDKLIKVPDIGDFDTVDVIEVLVKVGDTIKEEDPLLTLESDKASMEIPAPEGGVIKEIKVAIGDKIAEGAVILVLEAGDTVTDDTATEAAATTSNETVDDKSSNEATSSIKDIVVPDIGDFDTVDVIEILVKVGDTVNEEDALITLESDKASMEIPSTDSGVIQEIKINIGDKIAKGDTILSLAVSGAAKPADKKTEAKAEKAATPEKPAKQKEQKKQSSPLKTPPIKSINESGFKKAHASPAIRKFARELGADLSNIQGTGPKNRILKEDVQAYIKQILTSGGASAGGGNAQVAELPNIDFSKFGEIETQPLSKINKLTGKFLHRSWFHVPHVTQFDEADITDLDAFRKQLSEEYKDKGIKITFLAFLLKAVISSLKEFPRFNASLDNSQENIIIKKYYHIGVAVNTPDGLVVPVVRDVDKKTLVELAEEISGIAKRAREKKITPAEMQGACFTISSLGGIGGTAFTPIVNQPEVAILGVSKTSIKPVYIDNEFVPRKMLPISLSYDHRVIDGVAAAQFTTHLASVLSDARRLLL